MEGTGGLGREAIRQVMIPIALAQKFHIAGAVLVVGLLVLRGKAAVTVLRGSHRARNGAFGPSFSRVR